MSVATAASIGMEAVSEVIAKATLEYAPLFMSRYFKGSKGEDIRLKEFHLEWVDAVLDPSIDRLLILAPATHGKSTLLSRFITTYLMAKDPNIRIMHIMQNATDAEQNLVAIQREMEDPTSLLVQEHGPFKGKRWTTTQFDVAKRSIVDKEPTFAAYGTGSNVFGHRADYVILDDPLNLDNSGPQVTEATRKKVHDWFFEGVLKVAKPRGKVVVIGTPMDFRDLYHELMEPRHGFKVIKMKALLDDEKREVLWPEQMPYEKLVAERESDPVSFMKRYQTEAIDSSALTFLPADLEKCLDLDRGWGEITPVMRQAGRTHIGIAFDPSTAGYCGLVVGAFDPKEPEPRTYDILEIVNFKRPFEATAEEEALGRYGQVETLIHTWEKYAKEGTVRFLVIEGNGYQQAIGQSRRLREFQAAGHHIEPHSTGRNKIDPEVGVETLGARVRGWKIRFPYRDEESRRWVSSFFEQEAQRYPMASLTDRIMALWMFVLKASALSPSYLRVRKLQLPTWAQGMGLNWARR